MVTYKVTEGSIDQSEQTFLNADKIQITFSGS